MRDLYGKTGKKKQRNLHVKIDSKLKNLYRKLVKKVLNLQVCIKEGKKYKERKGGSKSKEESDYPFERFFFCLQKDRAEGERTKKKTTQKNKECKTLTSSKEVSLFLYFSFTVNLI